MCRKFVTAALNDDSLEDCKKLGAWQNRANQLLDDLVLMKNVCLKQQAEAEENDGQYRGGSNGGGGNYPKPKPTTTKPPAPYKPKPTNYQKPKPSKKPKKPKY